MDRLEQRQKLKMEENPTEKNHQKEASVGLTRTYWVNDPHYPEKLQVG